MFRDEIRPFACVQVSDIERWQSVVRICSRFTPLIEEHPKQSALALALDGSERLLLGERGNQASSAWAVWPLLGEALLHLFAKVGLSGDRLTVGIGPTRTLAWLATRLLVRHGSVGVVPPDEVAAFLANLPVVVVLDVPDAAEVASLAEILGVLEAAGIRTLEQLQRLTPEALTRRFGAAGASLAALGSGRDLRPLRPRVEESWLGARLVFEPPLAAEKLMVALAPLAERLALTLMQRELATGRVALVLESETGKQLRVERRLTHPLGTTRALLGVAERLLAGLLCDRASERLSVGKSDEAPGAMLPEENERYITLRLRLGGLHQAKTEQHRLWATEQQQAGTERVERLATALQALKGGKHVNALLRAEMHQPDTVLPEERYRLVSRSS